MSDQSIDNIQSTRGSLEDSIEDNKTIENNIDDNEEIERDNTPGTTKELSKECTDILDELEEGYTVDIELNKEGKPAVKKLSVIEDIYTKLLNKKIQEELLDFGLLSLLKKWLEPLPDGSLPPQEIKQPILTILLHLSPEIDHLTESEVGKIVLFYAKNPHEASSTQRLAKQIVLKWIELAKNYS
ncbi:transcription factor SPN1 [Nematocida sp. AWRm80]|nr:transcription factor SPN1 [Nematocida sp. AWRm80]